MRILVISDTHGDNTKVYHVYKKLISQEPVDLVIHCGDYYKDAIEMGEHTGARVVWVKGNTDGAFSDMDFAIVETEFGNILVTHGHMENVDFSQQNLYYKAQENNCCAAVFGHTHRGSFAEVSDVYLMNPGSLSRPRDGSGGTFGLITTSETDFSGKIIRYDDFMAGDNEAAGGSGSSGSSGGSVGGKSKKVCGGHLRELLNYSDRF